MIKCIIFDCDGTLVDSEHLFNRALSEKLAEQDIELSETQLVSRFRGVQLKTVLNTLEHEYNVILDEHFIDAYRRLVEEYFEQHLRACDGVTETLAHIDLAMCVASNGPLAKMELALKVTNLAHYFDEHLFSAYEINSWKPEPDLFLHAAQRMRFAANQCLVVEDSIVGIQAAQAAGMTALLYDPHNVHTAIDDVIKITSFNELLEIIN